MTAAPHAIPLDHAPEQACVAIHHVEATDEDMRRLMTLGICAGRRVELLKNGDPMILKVFGSRLGVSRRLAHRVMVTICETKGCPL